MLNWIKRIICISLSVALYCLPFFFPDVLWSLILLFPLPLLYLAYNHQYSFIEGFIWAASILSLHLHGIFISIAQMAEGSLFWKLVPMVGIVFYLACVNGLICWVMNLLSTKTFLSKYKWIPIITTSLGLFLFFLYIDNVCLFPFGVCEGYMLMNPILPLASRPGLALLKIMPVCGQSIFMGLLFLLTMITGISYWHRRHQILWLVIFAAELFVLLPPDRVPGYKPPIPEWINHIVAAPVMVARSHNLTFVAKTAGEIYAQVLAQYKDATIIVSPESSLNCEFLAMPLLTQLWSETQLGKPIHVIVGAYRRTESALHNSLYWVYNGVLQKCYDKRHGLILTERMPAWLRSTAIYNLFFEKHTEITPAHDERPLFIINEQIQLVPYICSELFFNKNPDDIYHDNPILAVCNDAMMKPYVARLMWLAARFKAIAWRRPIIYIAYQYQAFFDEWGNVAPINAINLNK